ncbi:MAG: ASPIC/UnbV domain-containing protein, partial [Chloroflexota bacterium]
NWLTVDLSAVRPGTRVEVVLVDGTILQREVHTGSSYLASEDPRVHFGLGDAEIVRELTIFYVTGEQTTLNNISANQIILIDVPS